MPDIVRELRVREAALAKLGARSISAREVAQLPRNRHAIVGNPRGGADRRFLVGVTDGGRWSASPTAAECSRS